MTIIDKVNFILYLDLDNKQVSPNNFILTLFTNKSSNDPVSKNTKKTVNKYSKNCKKQHLKHLKNHLTVTTKTKINKTPPPKCYPTFKLSQEKENNTQHSDID